MTARTLEEQLKDVRARHPSRTDIKPILDALEPHLSFQRTGSCHRTELESWTHSGNGGAGGLLGSIRNTFQSLVLWSTNPEISMAPPSYTHRQVVAGVRMLGASRVLRALEEELKLQTEAGSGDLALDVAAMIVSAPMLESFAADQMHYHPPENKDQSQQSKQQQTATNLRSPVLTLRDALSIRHQDVPRISEKDPLRAEMIVRLYRRVNAVTAPTAQVPSLDVSNILGNVPVTDQSSQQAAQSQSQTQQQSQQQTQAQQQAQSQEQEQSQMDLDANAGDGDFSHMLDTAAAAAGDGGGGMDGMDIGTGLDTSIDDVLNAADIAAVGNPEFLDLDGMF